jgi:hypothetical protein
VNDELKEFYAPHPGVGGAAVRLPRPIKAVADGLAGKRMSVSEAIGLFRAVAPTAEIEDIAREKFIMLKFHFGNGGMHAWCVIRYR